jgi:LuxR family quorum sensing-dependent transcriptional regulator
MDRAAVAFSWIDAIERAATPTAVLREMARAARDFGLDHLIVAGIPAPSRKLEPYVLVHNWPAGWFERYNSLDYLHVDPVIRELRSTTKPVTWTDAPYDPASDKTAHAVMMEAREFRLNNGLSIPIRTHSGDQAAVSFGGAHFELSEVDKRALHLIGIYGHARAHALEHPRKAVERTRPALSRRELDILQWVAAGKRSDEIAEALDIAYSTVETYIQRACVKLDAVSRTHAVAEAIRAHLIR